MLIGIFFHHGSKTFPLSTKQIQIYTVDIYVNISLLLAETHLQCRIITRCFSLCHIFCPFRYCTVHQCLLIWRIKKCVCVCGASETKLFDMASVSFCCSFQALVVIIGFVSKLIYCNSALLTEMQRTR